MGHLRRAAAALTATAVIVGALCATTPVTPADAVTGAGGKVSVTYTAYNENEGSYRLDAQPDRTLLPLANDSTPTVIVDPSVRYQTYEGFGGTLEDTTVYHLMRLSPANREAALQAIFSEANGDNFSLMRTTIGCADFCRTAKTTGFWTYDDNGGVADPTLANFSIQHDIDDGKITVMRDILRINPEARFFASMWSPPAWMKTSNSLLAPDNKNCTELPANSHTVKHGAATGSSVDYYPVLAQYYVKYIQAYAAQGIPISVVSLQNEPDIARTYPTNCFTPCAGGGVRRHPASRLRRRGPDHPHLGPRRQPARGVRRRRRHHHQLGRSRRGRWVRFPQLRRLAHVDSTGRAGAEPRQDRAPHRDHAGRQQAHRILPRGTQLVQRVGNDVRLHHRQRDPVQRRAVMVVRHRRQHVGPRRGHAPR